MPLATLCSLLRADPVVLVKDGQPTGKIWHGPECKEAAEELRKTIEKITGAKLPVVPLAQGQKPPEEEIGLVAGSPAIEMGLAGIPQTISGDGYRLARTGNQVLLAGETAESTYFAACHFLETIGCRWFFDNNLGEEIPSSSTVSVEALDIIEKPDFISRLIWGPNWHDKTWKRRNRMGGLPMSTGHDWAYLPAEKYFKDHPEYYALRGGQRKPSPWLCTTNPDVQRIFAESLSAQVKGKGRTSVSISPPDGRGYCECEACRALDDPAYLEPSSATVAVSDRYQHFFNAVAQESFKANPEAILNFYAYADYSLPPRHVKDAPENLCVWMAPIRFCRMHSMASPLCASRQRLRGVVEGWQKVVKKLGWREYNYNLAELTAPFSKISIWKDDIPYLYRSGCLGINLECLALWHIYGPHTYLATRLAWDADADVDAILDDFYTRFCGKAAPHIKAYWQRIDEAYRKTNIHSGCFYSLHAVWKPELVEACEKDLTSAAQAAESDRIRSRVEMFRKGFQNVGYYLALRDAANRCDFLQAKKIYDQWLAHMDALCNPGIHTIGEYKRGYVPRFLGRPIEEGAARSSDKHTRVVQLPDEWLFRYDPQDEGEKSGWQGPEAALEGWQKVKTFSATLNEQGIEERLTQMWYRAEVDLPALAGDRRVFLWFAEIDGRAAKLFLNGELAGELRIKREPFEIEITGKLRAGKNLIAVKVDHSSITELMLGGIIKPVMIYSLVFQGGSE